MLPDNTQSEYSCPLLTTSKSDFEDKGSVCSSLTLSLSVQLLLCDEEGNCETELVPDVNPFVANDDNILLHSVMEQLKNRGYSFKGAVISYYSAQYDSYIFCALDPVPSYITISLDDVSSQTLVLRVKLLGSECKQDSKAETTKKKPYRKPIRIRLRKIGEVVEKVTQWRRMNSGYVDDTGMLIKMTLMEAATVLCIPKKSLDDYLFLLKQGRQYGFDFNMYKNHTVGTLRSFIKRHRGK